MLLFAVRRALRWRTLVLAVVGVSFAALPVRGANEDLRKKIDELNSAISALPQTAAGDPELQKSIRALNTALQNSLATNPGGTTNDDLRKQIEGIKNRIAPFPRSGANPDLQKAFGELVAAVQDATCDSFLDPVDCYGKRVKDAVIALETAASDKKLSGVQAEALEGVVDKLVALLPPPPPPKNKPPVINIIKAYYGDFRTAMSLVDDEYESKLSVTPYLQGTDNYRICSATQSLQTYCQGKAACWMVTDGSPSRTGVNLCGYEPAPYADPINKGLAVRYQCVAANKLDLSKEPGRLMPEPGLIGEVRQINFRLGETAQIYCSDPPAAAAGAKP